MRSRWIWLLLAALLAAAAGFVFGQLKNQDYLAQLYQRTDFTLLDDKGEFFQLSQFPERRHLLLIFTPDGIPPADVKPFHELTKQAGSLGGVEVMLITRTNREIARNFKEAAGFQGRLLVDASGTVGRIAGIWPGIDPVSHWGYALIDRDFRLYWVTTASRVLSYQEVRDRVERARASPKTLSVAP
jgi:peroxiredoxin